MGFIATFPPVWDCIQRQGRMNMNVCVWQGSPRQNWRLAEVLSDAGGLGEADPERHGMEGPHAQAEHRCDNGG